MALGVAGIVVHRMPVVSNYSNGSQFLLTLLAGWINRRQLEAIEYLKEENRLLKPAAVEFLDRTGLGRAQVAWPWRLADRARRLDIATSAMQLRDVLLPRRPGKEH